MRNQFAVLKANFGGTVSQLMFESSSTGEIYAWLKERSALDAPGFYVIDRFTSVQWEEGTFIREFEEEMANAKVEHACVSEERIRVLIQEELTKFVTKARKDVGVPEYYGEVDLVDKLTSIIGYMAEVQARETVNAHEDIHHERKCS